MGRKKGGQTAAADGVKTISFATARHLPGKGFGLIADEALEAGVVILEEKPFLHIEAPLEQRDQVAAQLISKNATFEYQFEGQQSQFVSDGAMVVTRLKTLTSLTDDIRTRLLSLCAEDNRMVPADHPLAMGNDKALTMALRTLKLPQCCEKQTLLQGLEILACCAMQGKFLYEHGCRANHACRPNASWEISEDTDAVLRLRALRRIAAGEEVTISYAPPLHLLHWTSRRQFFWESWGFFCGCQSCISDKAYEGFVEECAATDGSSSGAVAAGVDDHSSGNVHDGPENQHLALRDITYYYV
eukprot:TRINITY_DN63646_c0_g1_i2.p1 TRINITY_DN63646_c0_g1~~TRINITY_DN63646_c0_g1_i2.p1  ORF type:complete len:301 (-),score=61.09 TRINITY_DN63646_c0_g1_i2:58-960(-)